MSLVDYLYTDRTKLELAKELARTAQENAALRDKVGALELELFWMKAAEREPAAQASAASTIKDCLMVGALSDAEIKAIPAKIGMRVSFDGKYMRSVGTHGGMTIADGVLFANACIESALQDRHAPIEPLQELVDQAHALDMGYGKPENVSMDDYNEALQAFYISLSGKRNHTSNCATSCAPAETPSACDCDTIMQPISMTDYERLYTEVLYAVGNKFKGESRHETALRHIRRAENVPPNVVTANNGDE